MYKEELVLKIKLCEDTERRKQLMEDLYFSNLGLIVTMCKSYCHSSNNLDDLLQIAYIALELAVRGYRNDASSNFLAYFRLCLKHECYQYWLKSGMPHELCKADTSTEKEFSVDYNKIDDMFCKVEASFMSAYLWDNVIRILGKEDSFIIHKRFIHQCTYKQIATEYELTIEGIRQRIKRCCTVLGQNKCIQEIATYYDYL